MQTAMETIRLTESDHRQLMDLMDRLPDEAREKLEGLENELFRAEIMRTHEMPADVVTMGSTVIYEDLDSGRIMVVQLSWPDEADIERGRISVLAPIGAALLGLRVGQEIRWPLPGGRLGRLKVKWLRQRSPVAPVHRVSGDWSLV